MSLEVLGGATEGNELAELLHRVVDDATAIPPIEQEKHHFIILTPARLRPYVERFTLDWLQHGEHPELRPGMTIGVHSFSSLVKSQVRLDRIKPVVGGFTLRAFLSQRMLREPDLFRKAGEVFGSTDQFAQQVTELVNAGVTAEDLEHVHGTDGHDTRLHALGLLINSVTERFGDSRVLQGGTALNAIDWVRENGERLHCYVHGFERVSAAELRLLAEIARHAHMVVVNHAAYTPDYLRVLEGEHIGNVLPELASGPDRHPQVVPTSGPVSEVRVAAERIASLLGSGVPANEILVTARDLSPYRALVETEFAAHGIALNSTPAATMADHPLAVLLLGLLDPALYEDVDAAAPAQLRAKTNAMLRVYRSGLIRGEAKVPRSDLDRVENALIVENPLDVWHGCASSAFVNDSMARIRAFIEQAHSVFVPGPRVTVRKAMTGMVRFLTKHKVNMSLRNLKKEGDAREFMFEQTRQVWGKIMGTLDEFVELLGDERFADFAPTFADNLKSMLSMEPLSVKPKALNAVDVIAFPTTMHPYCYVYVLGASESQLPAIPHESGLLDDSERRQIADAVEASGKRIPAEALRGLTTERKARREPLAFNRLLAYAEHVIISCPKSVEGYAQSPSSYVLRLFGHALPEHWYDETAHEQGSAANLVDAPAHGVAPETVRLLITKPENPDDPDGRRFLPASVSSIETYYKNPYEYFLQRGLRLKPLQPFQLDAALEGTYYHGVLEHALNMWMGKSDGMRDEQPTAAELSEYVDRCSGFAEYSKPSDGNADWLPIEEDPRLSVLDSSNRMRAIHRQMVGTLHTFAEHLEQSWAQVTANLKFNGKKVTGARLVPYAAEHQFGKPRGAHDPAAQEGFGGKGWPYLDGDVIDGIPVRVSGKIDRLDVLRREGASGQPSERKGDALFVLDYKSSPKDLFGAPPKDSEPNDKGSAVFYGHELQLLTYAQVARANGSLPIAGAMFLPIKVKGASFSDGSKPSKKADSPITFFSPAGTGMPGLSCLPANFSMGLNCGSMFCGGWNLKISNTSHWNFNSSETESLFEFALFKINDAAQHILDGDLPVKPYRAINTAGEESDNGMKFSDYGSIMAFDLIDDELYDEQAPITVNELLSKCGPDINE